MQSEIDEIRAALNVLGMLTEIMPTRLSHPVSEGLAFIGGQLDRIEAQQAGDTVVLPVMTAGDIVERARRAASPNIAGGASNVFRFRPFATVIEGEKA